eukprot:2269332-Amphidinium_carterae.1
MDNTVTPPAEPYEAPSGRATSPVHPPQHSDREGIAPEDDEAIPHQTVLPAALQLTRSTGGEVTLCCNYLTTRGAYRYQELVMRERGDPLRCFR